MQKADWLTVTLNCAFTAIAWFTGGRLAGILIGLAGIVFLVIWFLWKDGPRAYFVNTHPADQWKDMALRFGKISPQIWADWFSESLDWDGQPIGEQWMLRGKDLDTRECESLCRLAGAMLRKSERLSPHLSEKVKTRSDDVHRWLYFLKERYGLQKIGTGTSSRDGSKIKTESGSILQLGETSASMCNECAAREL